MPLEMHAKELSWYSLFSVRQSLLEPLAAADRGQFDDLTDARRPDRLHDRIRYRRTAAQDETAPDGKEGWVLERLSP